MSEVVELLYKHFEGDSEVSPDIQRFKWCAADESSRIDLVVDKFSIPANQTSDLVLSVQSNTDTLLTLLINPDNKTANNGGTVTAKINGGTTLWGIKPRFVMSQDLTALSVRNSDTTNAKELYTFKFVPVGTVRSEEELFNAVGARAWTDLTDTPSGYAGAGGKYPRVKSTLDGLELVTLLGDAANAPIQTISASGNISSSHVVILADASAGDITLTIPDGVSGRRYHVVKIDSTFNKVILDSNSGDIRSASAPTGAATYNMTTPFETAGIVTDATNWYVYDN